MYRGLANGRCRPVKRIGNSELHQSNVRSDTRTFSFFYRASHANRKSKSVARVRHPVLFHSSRDRPNDDGSILQVKAQLQLARRSSQAVD